MSCSSNERSGTITASRSSSSQPAARLVRHVRVVVAPRQHDHAPVDRAHQEADEQERRGVGQMGVVEHDRQRSVCGAAAEQVGNGSEATEAVGVDGGPVRVPAQHARGVAADELGEHGGPRPQRWGAAVRPAASPGDVEPVGRGAAEGVPAQRRLADPGRPADDEQLAAAVARPCRRRRSTPARGRARRTGGCPDGVHSHHRTVRRKVPNGSWLSGDCRRTVS